MGRPGARRRAESHLKVATRRIDEAQPRAAAALLEALEATTAFPKIIGRDEKGRPEYEYVEVPDHHVRVKAAAVLLNKRIPDLARTELTAPGGGPVRFIIDLKE